MRRGATGSTPWCALVFVAVTAAALVFGPAVLSLSRPNEPCLPYCASGLERSPPGGQGGEASAMRLLFISLEYAAGTFSGNGVYAQSQVKALEGMGHQVLVISGRPEEHDAPPRPGPGGGVVTVPLQPWGRLDHLSGWEAFGAAGASEELCDAVSSFAPQVVLGVDWHARPLYDALLPCLQKAAAPHGRNGAPGYVYLNYRVYSRQEEARDFLERMEKAAAAGAASVIALSRMDADHMAQHLLSPAPYPSLAAAGAAGVTRPHVLLPPLRDDMGALAAGGRAGWGEADRPYLTCCVRISPEKDPSRFVDLVEVLAARGVLADLAVTPLLVAAAKTGLAAELVSRLRAASPGAVVVEEFLPPDRMTREVYARTALNVHPCTYDAYGMTIVEAASQGAPSVMQGGGTVGAGDLLQDREAFKMELAPAGGIEELASGIEAALRDRAGLRRVGEAARARAVGWDLSAYGREFERMLREATG